MKWKKVLLSAAAALILTLQSAGAAYASQPSVPHASAVSSSESVSAADPAVSDASETVSSDTSSSEYTEGEEEMTYMGMTMQDSDSASEFNLHGSSAKSTATIRSSSCKTLNGIDVSHWQGTINWKKVAAAGIQFAVIKATGRGCYKSSKGALYTDGKFAANMKGAISAGIPVGVYCFSAAITEAEAIEEANYTCDKIAGYNVSLPVFIDYEYENNSEKEYRLNNGASVRTRTNIIDAFCRTVAARGYTPGVYANDSLLASTVDGASLAKKYTMWVASHSPAIHYYSGVYDMWQYSSKGTVDGISSGSSTDLDYWYKPASSSNSTTAMYRLYNPFSGEHFYTANRSERNHLREIGWEYEGVAWYAPTGGTEVYRLYNPNAGDHHYTANAAEKDYLVTVGWRYEGVGWYSADSDGTPLYRDYNPNAVSGAHNYTTSESEHETLIQKGWRAEGIGWYGI